MRNQVFTAQITQGILEFHQLNKQVVFGIKARGMHRALEVETQPFLNALHPATLCQVEKQHQVQHQRSGENAVAAEKVDLDLHRIAQPSEDVDVVPTFFIVASWRVVMNPDLVVEIPIEIGVKLRLKDLVKDGKLAFFLSLERFRVIENFSVPISQDIGGKPSAQSQHSRLQ